MGLQVFIVQDALDAESDDIRHEGLQDEIDRPRFKAVGLQGHVRRQEDNGDIMQALTLLHVLQDFHAVHFRHVVVEQHEVAVVFLQPGECRLAGAFAMYIEILLQHFLQQHEIRFHIIYGQDHGLFVHQPQKIHHPIHLKFIFLSEIGNMVYNNIIMHRGDKNVDTGEP